MYYIKFNIGLYNFVNPQTLPISFSTGEKHLHCATATTVSVVHVSQMKYIAKTLQKLTHSTIHDIVDNITMGYIPYSTV